jgi:hypothetical protein
MTEKTDDPSEKRMRNRMLRRIMPDSVIEEADAPNLPDAKRAIVKMMESRNVWRTVKDCKSPEDMHRLLWRCTYAYSWLNTIIREPHAAKLKKHDYDADDVDMLSYLMERELSYISAFGTNMFALGIVRGMQLGRKLDSKTEGKNVTLLLKHAAVRRLLLEEKPTALKICQALDRVGGVRMPWPKLDKQYGASWEKAAGERDVRTLITNARRAVVQATEFDEFLSVVRGAGDEGSITNQFQTKKAGLRIKAKK